MEQPLNSSDRARTSGLGSVLGIASFGIGLTWVVLLVLITTGLLELFPWVDESAFVSIGLVISSVGLGLGIAGNVLTRRTVAFSIVGIATNSMVIGFHALLVVLLGNLA